ncbi:pilus assembly protein TadG-related protein [Lichenihabitans sp. Uapishka_5]|uniref:pilus assembly protein TadG-related protein n=1 Tax=Lichenihabitans sp. Uapishka_5 TaxID=3037302 RepID=UPI0029E7FE81|nr:pilus assembly protein TadG-related protein [Lichenihabitans sp. Uapishka_5]MDX7953852.1 pilus assembly protein TadG-related protein [Lichenihabitans sp. Uapishka_5]
MRHRLGRALAGAITAARRLARQRDANVAVIFSLTALPLLFSAGMGLDYAAAARKRSKLNGVADAAALAAVTPAMMGKSAAVAKAAATSLFMAQANNTPNIAFSSSGLSVGVTDTTSNGVTSRNVTVTYAAASPNVFANMLGASIAIGGTAAAGAATAPNVDFYLLLDTSPSMAIAATTDGIATMMAKTPSQDNGAGCAFACHESNPAADNLGNPNTIDNYQLARNLGVTIRMDLVTKATQDLMDYATSVATSNSATYRAAISTFDYQLATPVTLTSNLSAAKSKAGDIEMLQVYKNNYLTASVRNTDMDTSWTSSIATMSGNLPTPGNGTNNAGDSPQEVLFIVTDGVADESNSGRQIYAIGGSTCTSIKNRGIRVAVLYTYYNKLPTNNFYTNNVAPFQSTIGSTLEACASPGLYTVVNTGDDISGALKLLFNKAVTTPHLTQ